MYKILKAETLAAKIHLMVVHAPRVASHCQPGQFIIVKLDEKGERIPLTICDYDREEGTVTIVFQEIGVSTIKMAELKAGDAFRDFVGPLGFGADKTMTAVISGEADIGFMGAEASIYACSFSAISSRNTGTPSPKNVTISPL